MDSVESIINAYKPHNRPLTNKTYISRVKNLLSNDIDLEDVDKVNEYLKDFKFKTKRSYYIAIVVYLKALGKNTDTYDELVKKMGETIQNEDAKNLPNEKETVNMVSKERIEDVLKKLEDAIKKGDKDPLKQHRLLQNRLIVNLYHLIPPVRNDYVSVKVYKTLPKKQMEDINYIVFKTKKMYMNRYKTDRTYGQIIVDIPKKIFELIEELFKYRKEHFPVLKNNRSLLVNNELKPMSKVNLIQNLNTIFNGYVSITMLRKSYISDKYQSKHSIQDMKDDAKIMGHSVALQQSTYRKKL